MFALSLAMSVDEEGNAAAAEQWLWDLPVVAGNVSNIPQITALDIVTLYKDLTSIAGCTKRYAGTKIRASFNVRPFKEKMVKHVKHFIHTCNLNALSATATAIDMDLATEGFDNIEKKLLIILKDKIHKAALNKIEFMLIYDKNVK